MKKLCSLFLALILLLNFSSAMASGLPDLSNSKLPDLPGPLPTILAPLPDPAESLGSIGKSYQENYTYNDETYNLFLYSQPHPAIGFINAYTQAAQDAGYQVTKGMEEDTYDALYITGDGLTAILMYEYQGYMLFMVPTEADFMLRSKVSPIQTKLTYFALDLDGIHYEAYANSVVPITKGVPHFTCYIAFTGAPFSNIWLTLPVALKKGETFTFNKKSSDRSDFYFDLCNYDYLIKEGKFDGRHKGNSNNSDYFTLTITSVWDSPDNGKLIEGTFECEMDSNEKKLEIKNGAFWMYIDTI